jgi:hypothetical protein
MILKRTGGPYKKRPDDQDHELTYWSEKLGIRRERLRDAVAKAGSMRKAVEMERRALGQMREGPGQENRPREPSILRAAADELGITTPKSADRRRRKGPIRVTVLKDRRTYKRR